MLNIDNNNESTIFEFYKVKTQVRYLRLYRGKIISSIQLKFIGESTKFVDVDEQNRDDEPPQYSAPRNYEEPTGDYEDDGYGGADYESMYKTAAEKNLGGVEEEIPFE